MGATKTKVARAIARKKIRPSSLRIKKGSSDRARCPAVSGLLLGLEWPTPSPDQIRSRRAIADALLANTGTPKTLGEGLDYFGKDKTDALFDPMSRERKLVETEALALIG
jgi:hypothetical protein